MTQNRLMTSSAQRERRHAVLHRGERHRNAERERDAEERLRQREEALEERVGDRDRERRRTTTASSRRLVEQDEHERGERERRAPTTSASHGAISPAASGRSAVRLTCASKSRSAQSLNAQPAERISSVPSVKISDQRPAAARPLPRSTAPTASATAAAAMPIGLSSRSSRSYASMRSRHDSARPRGGLGRARSSDIGRSDRQRELLLQLARRDLGRAAAAASDSAGERAARASSARSTAGATRS